MQLCVRLIGVTRPQHVPSRKGRHTSNIYSQESKEPSRSALNVYGLLALRTMNAMREPLQHYADRINSSASPLSRSKRRPFNVHNVHTRTHGWRMTLIGVMLPINCRHIGAC